MKVNKYLKNNIKKKKQKVIKYQKIINMNNNLNIKV